MARTPKSKRPKLSFEATHALTQASEAFFGIELGIERLEKPDLIALASEARRLSLDGHAELYGAVAAFADGEVAKLVARRSSAGIWYACLDVIQWEPNMHVGKGIASFSERCEGRDAAVTKARDMLVTHASYLAADATVDARVVTELEWLQDNSAAIQNEQDKLPGSAPGFLLPYSAASACSRSAWTNFSTTGGAFGFLPNARSIMGRKFTGCCTFSTAGLRTNFSIISMASGREDATKFHRVESHNNVGSTAQ